MTTKAVSCCNADIQYVSSVAWICSAEFMIQVRYLKLHYRLCTKLLQNCSEEKILKKVFCSLGKQQVLTFSNLLHRKAQIEAEFHHGQVS